MYYLRRHELKKLVMPVHFCVCAHPYKGKSGFQVGFLHFTKIVYNASTNVGILSSYYVEATNYQYRSKCWYCPYTEISRDFSYCEGHISRFGYLVTL